MEWYPGPPAPDHILFCMTYNTVHCIYIHALTHDRVASSAPANSRFREWFRIRTGAVLLEANLFPLRYKIIPRQRRNKTLKNVV